MPLEWGRPRGIFGGGSGREVWISREQAALSSPRAFAAKIQSNALKYAADKALEAKQYAADKELEARTAPKPAITKTFTEPIPMWPTAAVRPSLPVGSPVVVGEKGPEVFKPSVPGQVIPNTAVGTTRPATPEDQKNLPGMARGGTISEPYVPAPDGSGMWPLSQVLRFKQLQQAHEDRQEATRQRQLTTEPKVKELELKERQAVQNRNTALFNKQFSSLYGQVDPKTGKVEISPELTRLKNLYTDMALDNPHAALQAIGQGIELAKLIKSYTVSDAKIQQLTQTHNVPPELVAALRAGDPAAILRVESQAFGNQAAANINPGVLSGNFSQESASAVKKAPSGAWYEETQTSEPKAPGGFLRNKRLVANVWEPPKVQEGGLIGAPKGQWFGAASQPFVYDASGRGVLIPTVDAQGQKMSPQEAVERFQVSGEHMGSFDTPQNAAAYAQKTHGLPAAPEIVTREMLWPAEAKPAQVPSAVDLPVAAKTTQPDQHWWMPAASASPQEEAAGVMGSPVWGPPPVKPQASLTRPEVEEAAGTMGVKSWY